MTQQSGITQGAWRNKLGVHEINSLHWYESHSRLISLYTRVVSEYLIAGRFKSPAFLLSRWLPPGTDGYHPTWSTVVHSLWDWISNPWLACQGLIENFGYSYEECRCQADYKISDKSNYSRILIDSYLRFPGQQILTLYVSLSDKFQVAMRLFSKTPKKTSKCGNRWQHQCHISDVICDILLNRHPTDSLAAPTSSKFHWRG